MQLCLKKKSTLVQLALGKELICDLQQDLDDDQADDDQQERSEDGAEGQCGGDGFHDDLSLSFVDLFFGRRLLRGRRFRSFQFLFIGIDIGHEFVAGDGLLHQQELGDLVQKPPVLGEHPAGIGIAGIQDLLHRLAKVTLSQCLR